MERPISYERKNMELVLQVADYFNFEKLDDASPEMVENYENSPDEDKEDIPLEECMKEWGLA